MGDEATINLRQRIESVLQSNWPIPAWLTILGTLVLLALILSLYLNERGSSGKLIRLFMSLIRFSLLAIVVWMWAGWSWLQFRSDKPELLMVIDRSASMDNRDAKPSLSGGAQQSVSRLKSASDLFASMKASDRERMQRNYQIRWILIDEAAEQAAFSLNSIETDLKQITASGIQSRLGDNLIGLLNSQSGRGTAAIIFVSDGINTSGATIAAAAAQARSAGIPIYAIAVGQELAQPDVRLADLLLDEAVFLGDQVTVLVTVNASDISEASFTARLRDDSTGELLDQQIVKLTKQRSQQQICLSFVPKRAGEFTLKLDVSQAAGETNLENNVLQRSIFVQDKTLRVLLVQQFPSFEFRFLKNLLQRSQATDAHSASFELSSVLQESDLEYVEQDATAIRLVPSDAAILAGYDVFVFGDMDPNLISRSAQQKIVEQVTAAGAGCIFIAGRDTPLSALIGSPLADLLPIQLNASPSSSFAIDESSRYYWSPTTLGSTALPLQLAENAEASAKVWASIPATGSVYQALNPKLGAQILAIASQYPFEAAALAGNTQVRDNQPQTPLLISQFAGAGRVALQTTDETYRWTSFSGTDRYHQRYWEQMLRWLSRGRLSGDGQPSKLKIEPRRSKLAQPIRFELQLAKDADSKIVDGRTELTLQDSAGEKSALILTRVEGSVRNYAAVKSDLPSGEYRAVVLQPSLQQPPSESFTVVTPPGEQANLRADWTAMRQLAEQSRGRFYLAHESPKVFDDLPPGKPARIGSLPSLPIWNTPLVAAAFVLLITSEWLLRRRSRML